MHADLLNRIREDQVTSLCRDLVRFKTVNPPGNERICAEYVAGFLEKAGFSVQVLMHAPERASVVARLKGSGELPALLISGHLDVVPVGAENWLHDPFAGETKEGKLWGRGTSDMKGGDAAILSAAQAVAGAEIPLRGDLILAFTAGEEGEQLGASEVAKLPDIAPIQAVVIAEPSSNDIFIAEKGVLWLEVSTHGKTAHGSAPQLGRNAIMMMVDFVKEIERLEVPFEEHPLLGRFTRSINSIEGGVKTNVVPDRCVVTIDQRTVPNQDHAVILKQMEDLIADLASRQDGFSASVKVINDRIPLASSAAEPVVQRFCDIVAEVTGMRPQPKGAAYYTDAVALVPAFKAPLIICGPGEVGLAHQPNEYVEVAKMVAASRIYALAIARLLT
jgi:succinyl-diaminopimelate desuccinylase